MSNGPIKPPVVWHLDSSQIQPKTNSPKDRLTRIKEKMEAFEAPDSKVSLKSILRDIEDICNETDPPEGSEELH
jgi:hypothetical protein